MCVLWCSVFFLSCSVCVAVAWVPHVAVVWVSRPTVRMCFPWCSALFLSCCVCFAVAWVAHVAVVWVPCPTYECVFHGAVCFFCEDMCVSQLRGSHTWQLCGCLVSYKNVFSMVWCAFSILLRVFRSISVAHAAVVWVFCPTYECVFHGVVCFFYHVVCVSQLRGSHTWQLCGCLAPHMNVLNMWCVFCVVVCMVCICVGHLSHIRMRHVPLLKAAFPAYE